MVPSLETALEVVLNVPVKGDILIDCELEFFDAIWLRITSPSLTN
jgi:hypothetical protein